MQEVQQAAQIVGRVRRTEQAEQAEQELSKFEFQALQALNFRLFRLCVSNVARCGDRTEVAFRTTASGICSVASWVCRGETQNANNLLNHQFVGGVRGFCHIFRQFGS